MPNVLRKRFEGDTYMAQEYTLDAMKLLAGVKQQMAFNKLPQGSRQIVLESGVTLSASSRFGQDEVRIFAPSQVFPVPPAHEDKPRIPQPYMWIGVRVRVDLQSDPNFSLLGGSNSVPWNDLVVMVAEPGQQGVLTTGNIVWMAGDAGVSANDISVQDAGYESVGTGGDRSWVGAARRGYMLNTKLVAEPTASTLPDCRFTKNLLRMYDANDVHYREFAVPADVWTPAAARIAAQTYGPFDPQEQPGDFEARAVQTVGGSFAGPSQFSLWDCVVVLDPDEGNGDPDTTTTRPADLAATTYLQGLLSAAGLPAGDSGTVLAGDYQVFIGGTDVDCPVEANPWTGQLAGYPETPFYIEVEVRVGKAPDTQTQRIQVAVPAFSGRPMLMWPFGDFRPFSGACDYDGHGENPHSYNWWPGVISVDPLGASITVTETYVPDGDVFGIDGKVFPNGCGAYPWIVYVQVFQPYSAYATSDYPTEVARQVYILMVEGGNNSLGAVPPFFSLAQVRAAAALVMGGSGTEGLFRYDPTTNVFLRIPSLATSSYSYDTSSNFDWEYVYRWQETLRGVTLYKVRLGMGSPVQASGPFSQDPPDVQNAIFC